jgi:phage shock protein PspC (stress-responsive transcriptional regulator)/DNA-binding CsgD family transcriptional regulator
MSSTSMPNPAVTRPTLRRDADRRLLLGVCAGIARVLDTDPVIVRAAWIVIGLFTGPLALIAYVAAAIIVPRDDGRMLLGGEPPDRRETVLLLIARGYTYKEIAGRLHLSIKTVETHVSSVLRKLQLTNRNELTRWAAQRRII